MKKLLALLMVLLAAFIVSASPLNDISITFGQGISDWTGRGISFSYGCGIGLTKRIELDVFALSSVTPVPFEDNTLVAELGYSLLGDRNTGTRVSGPAINSIIAVGGFYNPREGSYGPLVGISPLATGNPSLGRRERLLHTDVGYDFGNSKVFVAFSLLDYDLYVKGSYRDWI